MMRLIGPLILVALIAWLALSARKHPAGAPPTPGARELPAEAAVRPEPAMAEGDLVAHLATWVEAGLVSRREADAILAHEGLRGAAPSPAATAEPSARARPARGTSPVAEALGYLGGIFSLTGLVLMVARYWEDMATPGRLLLSGAGALAFLGAGLLVRERETPAFARLRGFVWLASTAAAGLFMGVLATDGFGAEATQTVVLAVAGMVAMESGLLWRQRDRPIQQATFLAAVATLAGALVAQVTSGGGVGIAVWVVGATYLAIGLRRWSLEPVLTEGAGALAVIVGAITMASAWEGPGLLIVVASALVLVALGVTPGWAPDRADQLVLGVMGGLTLLQSVPSTIGWFARDAGMATGLATWAAGAALLYVGATHCVRLPVGAELLGGAAILGGGAITAVQWSAFAPVFGIATAIGLVALGMIPGQVLLSMLGSVGLLVNVPWAITRFFPGEARAPLLILVSGALILGIAVILSRSTGRSRPHHRPRRHPRGPTSFGSRPSPRPAGTLM